ncbi:MAG TPA: DUF4367 domain-containing protein [Anaerolineae bacterium]|nr:DUF4367 domain-containing protein [Anaerolineae bacterium]
MQHELIRQNLRRIAEQAVPDDTDLWPAIHARLIAPRRRGHSTVGNTFRRVFAFSAITLVVFATILLSVPPARAAVLEFLRELGGWIFTDEQTSAQQVVADPSLIPTVLPNDGEEVERLDVTESEERLGESIYVPSYIPTGYKLIARTGPGQNASDVAYMITSYRNSAEASDFFIVQGKVKVPQQADMGVEPTEVFVRGQTGLWFERAPISYSARYEEGGDVIMELGIRNVLVWEEGDGYLSISSSNLPLEETLKVAESLTK